MLTRQDVPLKPQVVLLADDNLTGPDKERVQSRLDSWIVEIIAERLKPLMGDLLLRAPVVKQLVMVEELRKVKDAGEVETAAGTFPATEIRLTSGPSVLTYTFEKDHGYVFEVDPTSQAANVGRAENLKPHAVLGH